MIRTSDWTYDAEAGTLSDSIWSFKTSPLTEEEKAIVPANCFGVYETTVGVRKAWLVHKPSPYDMAGFMISIK